MKCRDVAVVANKKRMRWFGSVGANREEAPVVPVIVQFEMNRSDRYYRVTIKFHITFNYAFNDLASPSQTYRAFHSKQTSTGSQVYIAVSSCLVEKKVGADETYSTYILYPATAESSVNGTISFNDFKAEFDDVNAAWTAAFCFSCRIDDSEYEVASQNNVVMHCLLDLYDYDAATRLLTAKSGDLLMPYITSKLFTFSSLDGDIYRYVSGSFKVLEANNSYNVYSYEVKTSSYLDGKDGLVTSLRQRLSVIKKELWYNQNYGLSLFDKQTTKSVLDSEIVSLVKAHPDVYDITEFYSKLANRHYTCSMTVKSVYGIVELEL